MNAPAGVECFEDARLFSWRPRGVLDEATLNEILAFVVLQEGRFGQSFNRFTDLFQIDAVDVTFKYVFHFALYRRLARLGREPLKSAILVTSACSRSLCKVARDSDASFPLEGVDLQRIRKGRGMAECSRRIASGAGLAAGEVA